MGGAILLLNLMILSFGAFAQAQSISFKLERVKDHIIQGFSESLEWYDTPIFAAYLTTSKIRTDADDKFHISILPFESKLQSNIGSNGKISLGSIDKDLLPYSVLISRMVFNVGFDLFSDEGSSQASYNHSMLFHKSLIYTYTLTELVKNLTFRERPDKSDGKSFFSGHSSTTFMAAAFLYRELDDLFDEWSVTSENQSLRTTLKTSAFASLYGWAGFVAYSRLHDNKHYLTDVLIGAAVGTLVGNLVYSGYFSSSGKAFDLEVGNINKTPSILVTYKF